MGTRHVRRGRLALCIVLSSSFIISGCILLPVMAVKRSQERKAMAGGESVVVRDRATANLETSPDQAYQAALAAMRQEGGLSIVRADAADLVIEASSGNDVIDAMITQLDGGEVGLVVRAEGGDDGLTDRNVALDIVTDVCERLGLEYKVEPPS